MPWLQIKIDSSKELAETLSEILHDNGALSVTLEDAADQPLFEPAPQETPLWSQTRVIGLYENDADMGPVQQRLQAALPDNQTLQCTIETLPDQDWERAWMSRFVPMDFGHGLWVCPSWCEPPAAASTPLVLDPGMAFGTGTHSTTSLCLRWLAQQQWAGKTLVDYGCGSGILAIAAVLRGARAAWGVDIDPQAVRVSQENARRNRVDSATQFGLNNSLAANLEVDAVIANILLEPLLALAPTLKSLVKPGGKLVLSGILSEQAGSVFQIYSDEYHFTRQEHENWLVLIGTRNPH